MGNSTCAKASLLCCRAREALVRFFSEAPGALKNHLNTQELLRISVAALMAGGGLFGVLEAVTLNLGVIFPSPTDAAFAGTVVAVLSESYRRLGHGDDHAPARRRPYPSR